MGLWISVLTPVSWYGSISAAYWHPFQIGKDTPENISKTDVDVTIERLAVWDSNFMCLLTKCTNHQFLIQIWGSEENQFLRRRSKYNFLLVRYLLINCFFICLFVRPVSLHFSLISIPEFDFPLEAYKICTLCIEHLMSLYVLLSFNEMHSRHFFLFYNGAFLCTSNSNSYKVDTALHCIQDWCIHNNLLK